MTVQTINFTTNSTHIGEAEPAEGMNIIIIPKQDVKFSEPPPLKTKKAENKRQAKATKRINDKEFKIFKDPNDSKQWLLYIGESLAIGVFSSVYEMEHYAQKGYPIADIERHEAEFECLEDASDPAVH